MDSRNSAIPRHAAATTLTPVSRNRACATTAGTAPPADVKPTLVFLILVAGCGDVADTEPDGNLPELADAAVPIDTTACDPSPVVLTATVLSDVGTLRGSSLAAVGDRQGLLGNTHDCSNAHAWLANGFSGGTLTFDLGREVDLARIRIWNHGDLEGTRGANHIRVLGSLDNKRLFQISGTPTTLARTLCPMGPQSFALPNVRTRFVHLELLSTHGASIVGIAEVELAEAKVCN